MTLLLHRLLLLLLLILSTIITTTISIFFFFYINREPAKGQQNYFKKSSFSPDPIKKTVGEIEVVDGGPVQH